MPYVNNAIAAKVHAMYGRRLAPSDYDALMRTATVPEVASYLKSSTHYAGVLAGLNEQQVHRGQLEASLRGLKYEQYTRLIHFDFSGDGRFYRYVFLWGEIELIIEAMRFLGAGEDGAFFPRYSRHLARYCCYGLDALTRVRTHAELLEVLRGTPYYDIVRRHPPVADGEKDPVFLVACERELTTYYYKTIFDMIAASFSGEAQAALEQVFLEAVDAENLTIAYRLRRFFKNTPEEIRNSLLPFSTPSQKIIEGMLAAGTVQELGGILVEAGLADSPLTDEDSIENLTLRARHKTCKKNLRYSVHPPVVLAAYVTLMEIELENIINIIEAVRYGLPPQDIRKLLIF